MRRIAAGVLTGWLLVVATAACVPARLGVPPVTHGEKSSPSAAPTRPASVQSQRAADHLLARARRAVLRANTGAISAETQFGDIRMETSGQYVLDSGQASFNAILTGGPIAKNRSLYCDVVLNGRRAYLSTQRLRSYYWYGFQKRQLFPDLPAWPASHRTLPDRALLFLLNATATRLTGEDGSTIEATVPAGLLSGIVRDRVVVRHLLREASTPVPLEINTFRGRPTTLSVSGEEILASLARVGVTLEGAMARGLQEGHYAATISSLGWPFKVRVPKPRFVLDPPPLGQGAGPRVSV